MAGMTQETWTVLHDAAKRFVDKVSGDGLRHTDADGFDRETWRGMAELGWFGLAVPEALGGLGESVGALAPVSQRLSFPKQRSTILPLPHFSSGCSPATPSPPWRISSRSPGSRGAPSRCGPPATAATGS